MNQAWPSRQSEEETYDVLPEQPGGDRTGSDLVTHLDTPFKFIAAAVLIVLAGMNALHAASAGRQVEVRIVSSRPDTVSGDDVLVEAIAPKDHQWSVQLDGRDVTRSFHLAEGSGNLLALLTGMNPGKHTLAMLADGTVKTSLEIVDYPLAGPIFSGPHQEPFICQTVENGLGPALDADCYAKTVVQYYYKSTAPSQTGISVAAEYSGKTENLSPGFKPYNLSSPAPSDVAQTVTSDGRTVPYIVRRELGVINRAVYDIRFLHQPGKPLPTPWSRPTAGLNGRLVYAFGGGCGAGYRQGILAGVNGVTSLAEPLLAQGYAVATSTLNIFDNDCNDRTSAETLSMVKEHFMKTFGEPMHTIGVGGSGGSLQQHLIAQNYPGLLDGIIPSGSFPDVVTLARLPADCGLLDHAFATSKRPWAENQKSAVSGYATWRICRMWVDFVPSLLKPRNCEHEVPNGSIPKELIYDKAANPTGVRCDIYDNAINIFGRDPKTGFARCPLDNVGVQYGLLAFNSGQIDADQFIELNEQVGGYDEDGNIVATRTVADSETLRLTYQRGLVLTGGGGLAQTPIIDQRSYSDDLGDAHDRVRSLVTRARLIAANGHADNQIIIVDPRPNLLAFLIPERAGAMFADFTERDRGLLSQMDRWLSSIAADNGPGTLAEKVARDKPTSLEDVCVATDGEKIAERAANDGSGRCNQLYPPHGDPRIAAGGPLSDDVLKCELKPINADDYLHPLTADQLARLKAAFPVGVCDYSAPGVGMQATVATWQKF